MKKSDLLNEIIEILVKKALGEINNTIETENLGEKLLKDLDISSARRANE